MADDAGLITKSSSQSNTFQVLNRIAIEKIEAWFFGDANAMRMAYPKLSANFETSLHTETQITLVTHGKSWNVCFREMDISKQDSEKLKPLMQFLKTCNHLKIVQEVFRFFGREYQPVFKNKGLS